MLAPAKTGVMEDRSGSTLEFIMGLTVSMDNAFWHETVNFSLLELALLSVNDILLWCVELADIYDYRLSVLLWPLSITTKFSGISASSSLEIHVLRKEWKVTGFPSLWRSDIWAAVDKKKFSRRGPHVPNSSFFSAVLPNKLKWRLRLIHCYRPVAFERFVWSSTWDPSVLVV